jgi:hypothetical protein
VRSVLGNLVVQVEKAARAQAKVDEKEERGAERQREQARLLPNPTPTPNPDPNPNPGREQARLLAAYQERMEVEHERLARERLQAARLQQQQRSLLVRDHDEEEPATPCTPPATLCTPPATPCILPATPFIQPAALRAHTATLRVQVRDLEDELCMHERLQEAQARAAAGLPALPATPGEATGEQRRQQRVVDERTDSALQAARSHPVSTQEDLRRVAAQEQGDVVQLKAQEELALQAVRAHVTARKQQQQQSQQQQQHSQQQQQPSPPPLPPLPPQQKSVIQCCTVTRTELGQEIFTCKFPGCGKEFAARDAVRKHCRIRHLEWLRSIDPRHCVPLADNATTTPPDELPNAAVLAASGTSGHAPPPPVGVPLEGGDPLESDGVREANRERLLLAFVRNLQSNTAEAEPPAEKVAQIALTLTLTLTPPRTRTRALTLTPTLTAEKVAKIARGIESREAELFQSRQPSPQPNPNPNPNPDPDPNPNPNPKHEVKLFRSRLCEVYGVEACVRTRCNPMSVSVQAATLCIQAATLCMQAARGLPGRDR